MPIFFIYLKQKFKTNVSKTISWVCTFLQLCYLKHSRHVLASPKENSIYITLNVTIYKECALGIERMFVLAGFAIN